MKTVIFLSLACLSVTGLCAYHPLGQKMTPYESQSLYFQQEAIRQQQDAIRNQEIQRMQSQWYR